MGNFGINIYIALPTSAKGTKKEVSWHRFAEVLEMPCVIFHLLYLIIFLYLPSLLHVITCL